MSFIVPLHLDRFCGDDTPIGSVEKVLITNLSKCYNVNKGVLPTFLPKNKMSCKTTTLLFRQINAVLKTSQFLRPNC